MMTTYFIATVLGWYLVIMSLLLIFRRDVVTAAMRDVMAQPGLLLIIGVITLFIGLLMVISHNYWVLAWPVIVTVFGWIALISGIIRLFSPETVHKMWGRMANKSETFTVAGIIMLIIGLFLLFQVYFM
ncbi:MAG: DUF308 domain-containing protein [Legionella sp.]|nr:DUF308 domain-containing protein [Legionella sp.]